MTHALESVDAWLDRRTRSQVLVLAAGGVPVVGLFDYLTGNEVSTSLFYLAPVALAAWYAGRRAGVALAGISCVSWYLAELGVGSLYSHPAIPVWNALVRFGFFVITSVLLTTLRSSLLDQQRLARTDALTGLFGRRTFDERLRHDLALSHRRKSPLTLAYVDLDDFKAINDAHGHAEGDRVLRAVGRAVKESIRETDTAARLGGDEFALVLPDTDGPGAEHLVSKLRREIRESLAASPSAVTCSVGVVTVLGASLTPESAVAAADEFMYEVKRQGKGGVAFRVLGEAPRPSIAERLERSAQS